MCLQMNQTSYKAHNFKYHNQAEELLMITGLRCEKAVLTQKWHKTDKILLLNINNRKGLSSIE